MRSRPPAPAKETDLCGPLRDYLAARGYAVRSEVRGLDVVAERDGEALVFELKRSLTLSLVAQAVDRQRAFSSVYVVVPHPGDRIRSKDWRAECRLLRRLELGLVTVDYSRDLRDPQVEVAFHPTPFQRGMRKDVKRAVLAEMRGRSADYNQGGSTRTKIVTAYRENAIRIACCLDVLGPLTPARLRELGAAPNTGSALRSNFYKWFSRVAYGTYALTDRGRQEIKAYPELVARYRQVAEDAGKAGEVSP